MFAHPYFKRAIYALLFITLFVFIIRPSRDLLTHSVIFPLAQAVQKEEIPIFMQYKGGPSFYIVRLDVYGNWQQSNQADSTHSGSAALSRPEKNRFNFRGFGDKFFSLGALYFLVLGFGWIAVIRLYFIHLGITALSLACLFLALTTHPSWLYPMNLLVTYITPALSGIYVLARKKAEFDTR